LVQVFWGLVQALSEQLVLTLLQQEQAQEQVREPQARQALARLVQAQAQL
jgi:hypothetical protein